MAVRPRPANPTALTYPWPGLWGWIALNVVWITYDVWATRRKPAVATMSQTIGHYLAKPKLGPVIAGAGLGMVYHLLIEELLPAYWAEQKASRCST